MTTYYIVTSLLPHCFDHTLINDRRLECFVIIPLGFIRILSELSFQTFSSRKKFKSGLLFKRVQRVRFDVSQAAIAAAIVWLDWSHFVFKQIQCLWFLKFKIFFGCLIRQSFDCTSIWRLIWQGFWRSIVGVCRFHCFYKANPHYKTGNYSSRR